MIPLSKSGFLKVEGSQSIARGALLHVMWLNSFGGVGGTACFEECSVKVTSSCKLVIPNLPSINFAVWHKIRVILVYTTNEFKIR